MGRGFASWAARGDRAELEVPEAEGAERPRAPRVLVEAAGEADDRRELEAHPAHRDPTPDSSRGPAAMAATHRRAKPPEVLDGAERRERELVGRVGRQEKEQRPQRSTVQGRVHDLPRQVAVVRPGRNCRGRPRGDLTW